MVRSSHGDWELPMGDREALIDVLRGLKADHPRERVVTVVPASSTPYEHLLATLDDLRGPSKSPWFDVPQLAGGV
jgi:hypothetical protein